MSIGTVYFEVATAYRAHKSLVAAKFNGLDLVATALTENDTDVPAFAIRNPRQILPCLETDDASIVGSTAAARYVARCRANTSCYGRDFNDEGAIDTWIEFGLHELEVPLMVWLYPCMGLRADVPQATVAAKADVQKALQALETALQESKFLVGDFVSIADITIVCALKEGFTRVFDASFRKPYTKVCAWFQACCEMGQFKSVFGDVTLCTKADQPKPFVPKDAKKGKKTASPKVSPKQKPAKASPKQKPAAAPAASAPAAGGANDAAIKAVGDEIRTLKDKLKGDGLSGKKINEHPDIKSLVDKLTALKTGAATAPAAAQPPANGPAPTLAGCDNEAAIKTVGDEIRALKEKLKVEGLSGKKINEHAGIKTLVEKLTALKSGTVVTPAMQSPKKSPKMSPTKGVSAAPVAGGDIEAQVTAVGDEIRVLKEKLKGEGLSGKKINENAEVKALVAKLIELKSELPS